MTVFETQTYEPINCCVCGIQYLAPAGWKQDRQNDGESFFCPNGHKQHYAETTEKKLAKARAELASAKSQLALERDQRAAADAALDRLKKRIENGVCPCCKRSFRNVQRHMDKMHPGFAKP